MITRTYIILLLTTLWGCAAIGATTREELVSELHSALTARDKAAFEKCVNFDGIEPGDRKAFAEIEAQIFSWPSHHVFTTDRTDKGRMHAAKSGKFFTLNGEWTFLINIYTETTPSKGFVIPAGIKNGKCLVLMTIEETP